MVACVLIPRFALRVAGGGREIVPLLQRTGSYGTLKLLDGFRLPHLVLSISTRRDVDFDSEPEVSRAVAEADGS